MKLVQIRLSSGQRVPLLVAEAIPSWCVTRYIPRARWSHSFAGDGNHPPQSCEQPFSPGSLCGHGPTPWPYQIPMQLAQIHDQLLDYYILVGARAFSRFSRRRCLQPAEPVLAAQMETDGCEVIPGGRYSAHKANHFFVRRPDARNARLNHTEFSHTCHCPS